MVFRFLLAILSLFFFCFPVFAEENTEVKRVAVLEFRGVGIEEAVLLKLSDQSRGAAVDTLPKEQYLIITRENMLQVLDDMGKDASCLEGACEVEIGRNIGADLIITGDILKMGAIYVLTLKLYETKSGALLKTQEVEDEDLFALKGETYEQSLILLQEGLELDSKKTAKKKKPKNKKSAEKKARNAKIYTWTAGGLGLVSAAMYGITVSTHNAYFESSTPQEASQIGVINQISHTTALSCTVLSAATFITARIIAKEDKK